MTTESEFNDPVPAAAYEALKHYKRIKSGSELSVLKKIYVASSLSSGIELHLPNDEGHYQTSPVLNEEALAAQLEQFMREDSRPNYLVLLDKPVSSMVSSVNNTVRRVIEKRLESIDEYFIRVGCLADFELTRVPQEAGLLRVQVVAMVNDIGSAMHVGRLIKSDEIIEAGNI